MFGSIRITVATTVAKKVFQTLVLLLKEVKDYTNARSVCGLLQEIWQQTGLPFPVDDAVVGLEGCICPTCPGSP
jgi:hypothetical protein